MRKDKTLPWPLDCFCGCAQSLDPTRLIDSRLQLNLIFVSYRFQHLAIEYFYTNETAVRSTFSTA